MERSDIILTLLAKNGSVIVGTTRMQKLLFLIEKECRIIPEDGHFEFQPYRFGPASKSLYDDFEFLINLGYMTKSDEKGGFVSSHNLDEIENLNGDDFLDDENSEDDSDEDEDVEPSISTATDDLVVYRITPAGVQFLNDNGFLEMKDAKAIDDLRRKYGKKSLLELLRHVYSKYPDYTTESEIKDKLQ